MAFHGQQGSAFEPGALAISGLSAGLPWTEKSFPEPGLGPEAGWHQNLCPVAGLNKEAARLDNGAMYSRSVVRMLTWLGALLVLATAAQAAKEYVAPELQKATAYPARDEHSQEGMVMAADPYNTKEKARIFTLPYQGRGVLPVYIVVTNEGNRPVSLTQMQVQLVTSRKDKISPFNQDDLYRRFSEINRRPDLPSRVPLPLPRRPPRSIPTAGIDEIQRAPFQARAVEPGATQAGFLFFDVSGIPDPLTGAHLYVTGVRDASGKELMFFDIAMDKSLTGPSSH